MTCLVISTVEVRQLLPMPKCIDLMADALMTLGRGDAFNPLRRVIKLPNDLGVLGLMPGQMNEPDMFGLKVISVFPGNQGTAYDSHQGVVMLFETEHGSPVAIVDAGEITAIRTAAASGVATRLLAREDATTLGVIGSGVQAKTHIEAMAAVRSLRHVNVYSRNAARRERLAEQASAEFGISVEPVDSAERAADGADIICTTTSSKDPVLLGDWIQEGCHVNAVGSTCARRESWTRRQCSSLAFS